MATVEEIVLARSVLPKNGTHTMLEHILANTMSFMVEAVTPVRVASSKQSINVVSNKENLKVDIGIIDVKIDTKTIDINVDVITGEVETNGH